MESKLFAVIEGEEVYYPENESFKDLEKKQPIIDLHTCIQGEGKHAGIPHILIRMSGCNMNCQFSDWICDTAYASWKPETGKYSLRDVINIFINNPHIKHTFITGGEPTFNMPLLQEIAKIAKYEGQYVTIETNGTIPLPKSGVSIDYVSMSPKLKNSIPVPGTQLSDGIVNKVVTRFDRAKHEKSRTNFPAMKTWITNFDYQLKFVVTTESELEEIKEYQQILEVPNNHVYLMPEGVTPEQLQKRRPWIIEKAIELGYNFSDRLHIVAYGNKREA